MDTINKEKPKKDKYKAKESLATKFCKPFPLEHFLKMPVGQLIDGYNVEFVAKNTAYDFILSNGYFDEFKRWSEEKQKNKTAE